MSQPGMADPHQLFDDTSSAQSRGYGAQRAAGGLGYPASSASPQAAFLADPVSNMAMAYGSSLAAHGKELVDKNVSAGAGRSEGPQGLQGLRFDLCFPRSTASSLSPSSSITLPWTPCTWAKSWVCLSSPTCTRSVWLPGARSVGAKGACSGCPAHSLLPHRTGRYSTSRTPQWPPASMSMLQTSTFQVTACLPPHTLLPLAGMCRSGAWVA